MKIPILKCQVVYLPGCNSRGLLTMATTMATNLQVGCVCPVQKSSKNSWPKLSCYGFLCPEPAKRLGSPAAGQGRCRNSKSRHSQGSIFGLPRGRLKIRGLPFREMNHWTQNCCFPVGFPLKPKSKGTGKKTYPSRLSSTSGTSAFCP